MLVKPHIFLHNGRWGYSAEKSNGCKAAPHTTLGVAHAWRFRAYEWCKLMNFQQGRL